MSTKTTHPRPNIVYIHSHDTGRCIAPYGYPVETPHLSAFAREAVVFDNAFSCAPSCSPSRAALLTGMMPAQAGMVTNVGQRGGQLNDYRQHLIHTLKAAGYTTALSGLQHVASDPKRIGYDHLLAAPAEAERGAVEFIQQRQGSDQPFFLSVGFHETHRKRYHFKADADDITDAPWPADQPVLTTLPDSPVVRQDMADFADCVQRLDAKVGRVLDALRATGQIDNSIVIVTTDHGPPFPNHKLNLTDRGLGVMLMMRWPQGAESGAAAAAEENRADTARLAGGVGLPGLPGLPGGRCAALVSHLDIFPTLCDALGLDPPTWLQGVSLLPVLRGQAEQARDAAFGQVNYHAAYEPTRSARTLRYSYVRRFHDYPTPMLANVDGSPTKDAMVADGHWPKQPAPREVLFDLAADPAELANVAADPSYATALADMRQRLDDHMRATRDPLLQGDIPMPKGGRFNRQSDASPHDPPTLVG